jgi:hypothetical protein
MIIEYDERGLIFHIVSDPVPAGLADGYTAEGKTFLDFPPEPLPAIPLFNEDGSPMLGEDGEQILASPGYTQLDADMQLHYVLDGELTDRPEFDLPATLDIPLNESVEFDEVENGCVVRIATETETLDEFTVTDGALELEGDYARTYRVTFEFFPYIPHTIEVTVA